MLGIYQSSLIGLWFILATIVVQAMVLIRVHRRQPGYKVGVIDPSLGQESLFFRAHRTFWNSMENIVPLFGMAVLLWFLVTVQPNCRLWFGPMRLPGSFT